MRVATASRGCKETGDALTCAGIEVNLTAGSGVAVGGLTVTGSGVGAAVDGWMATCGEVEGDGVTGGGIGLVVGGIGLVGGGIGLVGGGIEVMFD